MDAWWDGANKLPFAFQDGGSYSGGPFRGVIHTTEFKTYTPSTKDYYGHRDPPHFTLVLADSGEAVFYQHFDITTASRALVNLAGGVETNRRSAIQIEIAWKAAEIDQLPEKMLGALWEWMRWVEDQAGVDGSVYRKFYGEEAKGIHSVSRMTNDEWNDYDGWCGHQHVPENWHWDPGKLDIGQLLRMTGAGRPPRCEVAGWFGVNAI